MVLLIVPLLAFNTVQPAGPDSPLEGVWELVSAEWEEIYALSGTYVVKDDVYTETIEISAFGNTGTAIDIKFKVEGDKLILETDWFH